ncbi:hypothetical protein B0H16DRAFT_1844866 [Mycena metata]|uniref:Uncharacterized protein n=1 Tax=Mycena metata TaxID=1033252 RepID=A0AAD7ITZ8_9AGAR|nr:hypothetical protein B0H16DRAFT_1844866 [Mycena metata]
MWVAFDTRRQGGLVTACPPRHPDSASPRARKQYAPQSATCLGQCPQRGESIPLPGSPSIKKGIYLKIKHRWFTVVCGYLNQKFSGEIEERRYAGFKTEVPIETSGMTQSTGIIYRMRTDLTACEWRRLQSSPWKFLSISPHPLENEENKAKKQEKKARQHLEEENETHHREKRGPKLSEINEQNEKQRHSVKIEEGGGRRREAFLATVFDADSRSSNKRWM